MAHANEDRIRAGYAAFGRGDVEALRNEYFMPDIIWHSPGNHQLSGDFKGVDEVLTQTAKVMELTGGNFSLELHDVLANDTHGVALGHVTAQRGDKREDQNYVHVFHFTPDGKVSESWIHNTDQAADDEFWA